MYKEWVLKNEIAALRIQLECAKREVRRLLPPQEDF